MTSRRPAPRLLVLALAVGALPACNAPPDDESATPPPARFVETSTSTTSTTQPPGLPVAGEFGATTGDGYTFGVKADLTITATVDVADAKPGMAFVLLRTTGRLTITNTTPGRNASLTPWSPTPDVRLLWAEADLARFGRQSCDFRFTGVTYCALAIIRFKYPGTATVLAAGESLMLPPTNLGKGVQGLVAMHDEALARWVVDQLNSRQPPKLLLVVAGGNLQQSCAFGGWVMGGPLAVLDGTGKPLLAQGSNYPADCKDFR